MASAATLLAATGLPHRTSAAPKPLSDVIILLPGITGSVLRKDNRDLWALSPSGIVGAIRTLGRNLDALKVKDDPPDVEDLHDGITADRLFSDVHLVPGLWKIDGYSKVAQRLEREFALERGRNYFHFPYDWRRDNRVAARRLERESHDWLKSWREHSGNKDAKLVLVAHSMGGLVARYFLECLDGWRDTRMLITFGAPYRGSPNALGFLANGFRKQVAGIPLVDLTDLLRSFTSVYQLLPIYPCYDAGDGRLARVGETTGIPGVDAPRAAKALAFHREIEQAVDAHRKDEAYLRSGYAIHPIVGTYQPTLQSARLAAGALEMSKAYPGRDYDGDGTVPRPSATPIELDGKGSEVFVAEVHGSLQNADPVLVQVAGLLTPGEGPLRVTPPPAVSLMLDDAYGVQEPIRIRSSCQDESIKLAAAVVDARTARAVARLQMRRAPDGTHEADCRPLPEGTYRVTVSSPDAVSSATDVFIVAGA